MKRGDRAGAKKKRQRPAVNPTLLPVPAPGGHGPEGSGGAPGLHLLWQPQWTRPLWWAAGTEPLSALSPSHQAGAERGSARRRPEPPTPPTTRDT